LRVLLLTVRRGMGEQVMLQAFDRLLGDTNVDVLETVEALTRESFSLDRAFSDNDVVIIFRDMLRPSFERYIRSLLEESKNHSTKLAVIDVADDLMISKMVFDKRIEAYFKREFLLRPHFSDLLWAARNYLGMRGEIRKFLNPSEMVAAYNGDRLRPNPLSYIEEPGFVPSGAKPYLVSYISNMAESRNPLNRIDLLGSWKRKLNTAKMIRGFPNSYIRLGRLHRSGLPHGEFLKAISNSIYSIADRGSLGYDTTRYWEVPYAGSIPIAQEPNILIPNNLMEGKHVFYYSSLKELKSILSSAPDETEARKMGRRAREFVMKYHSPQVRAAYVLDSVLGGNADPYAQS
jgi:hypothetical protein